MNNNLATLQGIESKVRLLLKQNKELKSVQETLKSENESLHKIVSDRNEKVNELSQQLQIIKLAKSVTTDNVVEGNTELKKKINELIKEIDHCVALLNN